MQRRGGGYTKRKRQKMRENESSRKEETSDKQRFGSREVELQTIPPPDRSSRSKAYVGQTGGSLYPQRCDFDLPPRRSSSSKKHDPRLVGRDAGGGLSDGTRLLRLFDFRFMGPLPACGPLILCNVGASRFSGDVGNTSNFGHGQLSRHAMNRSGVPDAVVFSAGPCPKPLACRGHGHSV
jgi:hypothetical protein